MAEMNVPMLVTELTPEWMTSALSASGALTAGTVTAVQTQIIGEGVGMVGQLARLTISYSQDANPLPQHMIAKLPSPYEANRAQMQMFRYYTREALFY
jgi:hypothetical protein